MIITINEGKQNDQCEYSAKILGAHISPSLSWKDELGHAKQKMNISIKKFMKVDMKFHQVSLCFNTYVLTNKLFGCGIVNYTKKVM